MVTEQQVETKTGKFVIRPYTEEDEEGVCRLWETVFEKEMPLSLWRWKYMKNPHGSRILVCVGEDRMITIMYAGMGYLANVNGKTGDNRGQANSC